MVEKEKHRKAPSRYRWSDIPHLLRSPLGRIHFWHGIYYRLWPVLSVLARGYRKRIVPGTRVVAVVGSFGKTTTTRAVTVALQGTVRRRPPSNCWSYVAAAVLRIRRRDRHAVIEVGINGKGQMVQYARMVQPDITVVTSIGSEHHRSLGSLDVTRSEKSAMVRVLPASGVAVLNGDDARVLWMAKRTNARIITFGLNESNDVRATDIKAHLTQGTTFRLHVDGETRQVSTSLIGPYMVYTLLAAIAVATAEGYSLEEALSALDTLPPTRGRLEPVQLPGGAVLLHDAHKSTLETVHAALEVFASIDCQRRGVVIGEVSEPPGSQGPIYRDIGRRIAAIADYAVIVGGNYQRYAAGAREAGMPGERLFNAGSDVMKAVELLQSQIGPEDAVLIKGRDTQRLERLSLALQGQEVKCNIGFCDTRIVNCEECPMLARGWGNLRVVL